MKKPEPTLKSVVIIATVIMCMWVAAGGAVALMTYRGVQDIRDISQSIDRSIVDSWTIETDESTYVVGEGPGIVMSGRFDCSGAAADSDILLQFRFEVRPADLGSPIIRPQPGVPRDARALCALTATGEMQFLADWHTLDALQDLAEPTEYVVLYSVESGTGWVGKQVQTEPFLISPAN